MKITKITPYIAYNGISDLVFVKVETDEPGLFGWGECSLPAKPNGVAGAVRDLEPLILGADPERTEWAWQRMYRHAYWRGGPIQTSALSGIDVALWDIRGKLAGKSVAALLGGPVRDKVKAYANLGLSLSPEEFRDRVAVAVDMGFKAVKIYPLPAVAMTEGLASIRQIVACCEAVRDELGDELDYAIDMHGRPSASLSIIIEDAVRHTSPMWIEEPVPAESNEALERLAQHSKTPIAVGERMFTRWAFREVLENEWAGIIQPDVSNAGGISELVRIAALAEMYGVTFAPHNPNGPVQAAASLNLAAYAQNFSLLETRHTNLEWTSNLSSYVPRVDAEGFLAMPQGPGLGVEINEDFLKSQTEGEWVPESFRADGSIADW
ncbi:galactonate dehydratase [Kaistia terrae]|uniref:Galactonate dehydratase n=1 Tax=Kaistia terrae TaxID=537017 RepID=A0ABW0Q4H1_9HYPH|nr:galactonate dehydratase [Kaistia terrae]MCX5579624.1 galactonate dehydratase [Kaistia terrae]